MSSIYLNLLNYITLIIYIYALLRSDYAVILSYHTERRNFFMPFLILAALVVIVLMLYIALGGKEGAPTISLNKILDFISSKPPAGEAARAGDAPGAKTAATDGGAAQTGPAADTANERPAAEAKTAAAGEAPETAGDTAPAQAAEAAKDDDASNAAAFASMEELTEFYRKEAERLTGIKH
jgi:hypothetical protein